MKKRLQQERAAAVLRYLTGEYPDDSCTSLSKTTRWLYKWISRYVPDDLSWFEDRSRRPLTSPFRTPAEIERIVELVRLNLYNHDRFCGSQAIHWQLLDMLSNRYHHSVRSAAS